MLENEQIRLRALEPEDLDFLYKWENDTRLWEYGNTMSPFSKYVLHQYIEDSHRDIYEAKQLRLMIEDKATGLPAGTIDLFDFDLYHNRAGVGILIDDAFQKRSYATMAITLMKDYAFKFLKIAMLYAYIPVDNVPSLHLFRKLGFIETAHLKKWNRTSHGRRDVYIYQLMS